VHQQHRATYPTNKVKSTRFNLWNFLPITILLQFTKVINVFYLGNAILQSFPNISTNNPLYTIVPLSILIFLGVLKEGLADYKRYKIDKMTNALPVTRLTGRLKEDLTENIKVNPVPSAKIFEKFDFSHHNYETEVV
jgi:hypothetical protein